MHSDLHPFWPVSTANPLLAVVGIGYLHGLCVVSGLAGAVILGIPYIWHERLAEQPMKLPIPPQGHRSIIKTPWACGGPAGFRHTGHGCKPFPSVCGYTGSGDSMEGFVGQGAANQFR